MDDCLKCLDCGDVRLATVHVTSQKHAGTLKYCEFHFADFLINTVDDTDKYDFKFFAHSMDLFGKYDSGSYSSTELN